MSLHELTSGVKSGSNGGSVVIMLALNLIMLALFILLNSFAKPSTQKSLEAIEGVGEGFDYRESGGGLGSDMTQLTGVPWHFNLQRGIDGLVHNQLMLDTADFEADASTFKVILPMASLFGDDAVLVPDRQGFLENAGALAKAEQGKVRVQVVVRDVAANLPLSSARAQAIAAPMMKDMAPILTVSAGVGEPEIELKFIFNAMSTTAGRVVDGLAPLGGKVKGQAQ